MTKPVYYDPQAYMKAPKHEGRTWSETKAHRARRWRAIKQAAWVLGVVAVVVALWVLR